MNSCLFQNLFFSSLEEDGKRTFFMNLLSSKPQMKGMLPGIIELGVSPSVMVVSFFNHYSLSGVIGEFGYAYKNGKGHLCFLP